MTFTRRWGYVLFMPSLVKESAAAETLFLLFQNDDEYYVQMAEAWLLSYLAIYAPEKTWNYLANCSLDYKLWEKQFKKYAIPIGLVMK